MTRGDKSECAEFVRVKEVKHRNTEMKTGKG